MMWIVRTFIVLSLSFSAELVEGVRLRTHESVSPINPAVPAKFQKEEEVKNASIVESASVQINPKFWIKYQDARSKWTKEAKWRICGLLLAYNYGGYWITGFSKKASKQGGGDQYSTQLDAENDKDKGCVQKSRFSPGFRVGMKLLDYAVPFDSGPAVDSLRFSWSNPIAHVDKRDPDSQTAFIGNGPRSDEDKCCQVHEVTQRCFEGRISHHCTVWIHFTPSDESCTCSGKMVLDLCNLDVTMDEALRAQQISPAELVKANDVKVQYELIKRKTSNSLTAFRVKMYPMEKDENGDGETYSLETGKMTMGQVRDLVYEYSEANPFYAFTSNTCQQFSAWMLAKITDRPELNVPWFNANYLPLLTAASLDSDE